MENEFVPDFGKALELDFFLHKTELVAKELLGKIIVKIDEDDKVLAGRIVETEAYLHKTDEASHSYRGLTPRNKPMFEQGGILYVYRSYGIHFCTNIVTEDAGKGCAVLIRAVEPLCGIEFMNQNRNIENIYKLSSGPGNFSKAFGFHSIDNYKSTTKPELYIQDGDSVKIEIVAAKRIGISRSEDLPLRFYSKNSRFISKK